METISNIPQLIERNTSVYLSRNLHYCHENRIYLYSWCFNIIIFCIFVVITIITLYICAKKKKTPQEKENDAILDQQYILKKIRDLKYKKNNTYIQEYGITNIPIPNIQ